MSNAIGVGITLSDYEALVQERDDLRSEVMELETRLTNWRSWWANKRTEIEAYHGIVVDVLERCCLPTGPHSGGDI